MSFLYYQQFERDMDILEIPFLNPGGKLPKLKTINSQYKKLSLKAHPDKKGGSKEAFQLLSSSFVRLSSFIAKQDDVEIDITDEEENELMKFFKQYNVVIENNGSITVLLENGKELEWETIFSKNFGSAKETPSGKSWKVDYETESLPKRRLTITKWDSPKSDGISKICIQGASPYYILFSSLELPKLYKEVLSISRSPRYVINRPDPDKLKLKIVKKQVEPVQKTAVQTKRFKIKYNTLTGVVFSCNQCDFSSKTKDQLRKHKMIHPNVSQLKLIQQKSFNGPKTSTRENSFVQHTDATHWDKVLPENISLDDIETEIEDEPQNNLFVEKEDDLRMNSIGCKNCKESFVNLTDLESHLNEHKETSNNDGRSKDLKKTNNDYKCDSCEANFDNLQDLKIHINEHLNLKNKPVEKSCITCCKNDDTENQLILKKCQTCENVEHYSCNGKNGINRSIVESRKYPLYCSVCRKSKLKDGADNVTVTGPYLLDEAAMSTPLNPNVLQNLIENHYRLSWSLGELNNSDTINIENSINEQHSVVVDERQTENFNEHKDDNQDEENECEDDLQIVETAKVLTQLDEIHCDVCFFRAVNDEEMLAHIQTGHDGISVICGECAKSFHNKEECLVHLESHTNTPVLMDTTPQVQCDECNQMFIDRNVLKNHKINTHKENNLDNTMNENNNYNILKEKIDSSLHTLHTNINISINTLNEKFGSSLNTMYNILSKQNEIILQLEEKIKVLSSQKKQQQSVPKQYGSKTQETVTQPQAFTKEHVPTQSIPMQQYIPTHKPKMSSEKTGNDKKYTLYLGDSIAHNISPGEIERQSLKRNERFVVPGLRINGEAKKARCYGSIKDNKSKFPDNNFREVVPKQMSQLASKGKIVKKLVIQASTTDITNTKHNSRDDQFKAATESSINMVKVVEEALKNNDDLEKVVLIERPPREDVMGEVSQFSNEILKAEIAKSKYGSKILYGKHKLLNEIYEKDSSKLYGRPSSPSYDGLHMRSNEGSQLFMDSLMNIFKEAKIGKHDDNENTFTKEKTSSLTIPTKNRYSPLNLE